MIFEIHYNFVKFSIPKYELVANKNHSTIYESYIEESYPRFTVFFLYSKLKF